MSICYKFFESKDYDIWSRTCITSQHRLYFSLSIGYSIYELPVVITYFLYGRNATCVLLLLLLLQIRDFGWYGLYVDVYSSLFETINNNVLPLASE